MPKTRFSSYSELCDSNLRFSSIMRFQAKSACFTLPQLVHAETMNFKQFGATRLKSEIFVNIACSNESGAFSTVRNSHMPKARLSSKLELLESNLRFLSKMGFGPKSARFQLSTTCTYETAVFKQFRAIRLKGEILVNNSLNIIAIFQY